MHYLDRYETFLQQSGTKFYRYKNLLLRDYNQIIVPLGAVKDSLLDVELNTKEIFQCLKGKLLWWNVSEDRSKKNNWYAIIKKQYWSIEDYPSSKMRNKLRKGLKNCAVRKISVEMMLDKGFEVYQKATHEYKQDSLTLSAFQNQIKQTISFEDIIEYWGVFVDGLLVGYTVLYIYGKTEVNMSEIRIDPTYNKLRPSYILIQKIHEEFLFNRGLEYVNNGYRNLLHETNIQQLLLSDFGYEKYSLFIKLVYRSPYGLFIKLLYLIKLYLRHAGMKAVFLLESLYREQKKAA